MAILRYYYGKTLFLPSSSPLTPLPLYVEGLTCVKSLITWPADFFHIAIGALSVWGSVAECRPEVAINSCVELHCWAYDKLS